MNSLKMIKINLASPIFNFCLKITLKQSLTTFLNNFKDCKQVCVCIKPL